MIEYLYDETADGNRSVIVTASVVSKLVFDDWNHDAGKQEVTYIRMGDIAFKSLCHDPLERIRSVNEKV